MPRASSLEPERSSVILIGALSLTVMAILGICWEKIRWLDALRPLPLVLCMLGISFFMRVLRWRRQPENAQQAWLPLLMVIFSLTLLGKMILHARVYHYGFALAIPATLVFVVALMSWIPAWITKHGGAGWVFRSTALSVLLVAMTAHLTIMNAWLHQKIYQVSTGPDAFWADARGVFVNTALEEIARRVEPTQALAVLPEGAMLNYLSRRPNPSPFSRIVPSLLVWWGEKEAIASFQAHPPDYIVLVHRDTAEDGFRFFGRDYGQRLYAWIQEHYRAVKLIGAPPLQDDQFGILLLQRHMGLATSLSAAMGSTGEGG